MLFVRSSSGTLWSTHTRLAGTSGGGGGQMGSMFHSQLDLIRRRFCNVGVPKPIHVPVRMPGLPGVQALQPGQDPLRLLWLRQVVPCKVLCRGARLTRVVEADVEEESQEAEEDGGERDEMEASEDDDEEESEQEGEGDEEEDSEQDAE